MQFISKDFELLTPAELYEILKLRNEVFIVEQNCVYPDLDNKDQEATHILMMQNDQLAGYARILEPGVSYQEPSIGRVVVSKKFRSTGAGKFLMQYCLQKTKTMFPGHDLVISAQSYLLKFYGDLGFIPEGSEYLEDDIPHTKMRLQKRTA